MTPQIRLVFETEHVHEDGTRGTLSRRFTASLNSKAKLAEFLGKWRGRVVVPGEKIDLTKLLGVSCTLVLSHHTGTQGGVFVSIDAVSKPTKKVTPSGQYDASAARERVAEWKAKLGAEGRGTGGERNTTSNIEHRTSNVERETGNGAAPRATADYDPEVGF